MARRAILIGARLLAACVASGARAQECGGAGDSGAYRWEFQPSFWRVAPRGAGDRAVSLGLRVTLDPNLELRVTAEIDAAIAESARVAEADADGELGEAALRFDNGVEMRADVAFLSGDVYSAFGVAGNATSELIDAFGSADSVEIVLLVGGEPVATASQPLNGTARAVSRAAAGFERSLELTRAGRCG